MRIQTQYFRINLLIPFLALFITSLQSLTIHFVTTNNNKKETVATFNKKLYFVSQELCNNHTFSHRPSNILNINIDDIINYIDTSILQKTLPTLVDKLNSYLSEHEEQNRPTEAGINIISQELETLQSISKIGSILCIAEFLDIPEIYSAARLAIAKILLTQAPQSPPVSLTKDRITLDPKMFTDFFYWEEIEAWAFKKPIICIAYQFQLNKILFVSAKNIILIKDLDSGEWQKLNMHITNQNSDSFVLDYLSSPRTIIHAYLTGHNDKESLVTISKDKRDGKIYYNNSDPKTREQLGELVIPYYPISDDKQFGIELPSKKHCAIVRDLQSNNMFCGLVHSAPIMHVEFHPDSSKVITCSADCTARVWNLKKNIEPEELEPGVLELTLIGHKKSVTCAQFIPKLDMIVTGSYDGTLRFWNSEETCIATIAINEPVLCVEVYASEGDAINVLCGTTKGTVKTFQFTRLEDEPLSLEQMLLIALLKKADITTEEFTESGKTIFDSFNTTTQNYLKQRYCIKSAEDVTQKNSCTIL